MGNVLIKEETMTAIADSIREKKGSTDRYKPAEMPGEILTIKTGGGTESIGYPSWFKPIRFYGAYGELLYSYTLEEFAEVTELPALPKYDGLLSQEWNWTLENIKEVNGEVEIGSLHITDDGSTRIYINLIGNALSPKLAFIQNAANAVRIDWGDGSDLESSEIYGDNNIVSMEHTYAQAGDYVIRLIPEEETVFTFCGNNLGGFLLHESLDNGSVNRGYMNTISKIELGTNIFDLGSYSFAYSSMDYVIIPSGIINFGTAFMYSKGLRYLVFPKGVTSVTNYAMSNCVSLEKVVFSESICSLGGSCFKGCSALREFVMSSESAFSSGSVLSGCSRLKRAVLPKSLSIIGSYMFENNNALEEVIVRSQLKQVSSRAFYACESLRIIDLPDTVYTIASNSFYMCKGLQIFRIPDYVSNIDANSFYNCYSLAEIILSAKITKIGGGAFQYCYSLKNYYLYATTPPTLGSDNSIYVSDRCKIHVPKGCLETYQTAEYWSEYADYMVEMEE